MRYVLMICILLPTLFGGLEPQAEDARQPLTFAELTLELDRLAADPWFTKSSAGQSVAGRDLWLMRIRDPRKEPRWTLFIHAQQHGDEPAGKDALLYLMENIHRDHGLLPRGVDLWILPLVNPDGAEAGQRRNANGVDLNRDDMTLSQPENQALHRLFQTLEPHLAIDCHEFSRDSRDYLENGWLEWPEIMMDHANHPFYDPAIEAMGLDFLERAESHLRAEGIAFCRYLVGGAPPAEQRHSTLEMDDARNAAGSYGGFSYIIEGGLFRTDRTLELTYGERVSNYLTLLTFTLQDRKLRRKGFPLVDSRRGQALPRFIPTNSFWGRGDNADSQLPVLTAGKKTALVDAPNLMTTKVIKRRVERPRGYVIGREHAEEFRILLDRHAIPYRDVESPVQARVAYCRLDSLVEAFDPVYNRYGGRQYVTALPDTTVLLQQDDLVVELEPGTGIRAALLLEPQMLFGLYQFPIYRKLIGPHGHLPVARLLEP